MRRFIREIHRRSLWQVLGIYLVAGWLALQVVHTLVESLDLPLWFSSLAIVLLIIGLPVVLATAFVQEGTGSRPAEEPGSAGPGPVETPVHAGHRIFTWRNAILGGVGAFALFGLVSAGWLLLGPRTTTSAAAERYAEALRSIAVLPFAGVQTDEESLSFRTGVHDDILTQLSRIPDLKVISRTSVMQYVETPKPIREIAAELGVATVLEGSVQRAGDRVRVNVQLIDARTDGHLWAETYDQRLTTESLFAIQSDIAHAIARALRAELTPEVESDIAARPTESLEAYDLHARGRYVLTSRGSTREGVEAAAELFRRSIEADSAFAPAWVGLAEAQIDLWNLGYVAEEEALPVAREAVSLALTLDDRLAEAHALQGGILRIEGRFADSERAHRRALELNPGSAEAHRRYAQLLMSMGRPEEAVAEARRAVELDPRSASARRSLLVVLVFDERLDEVLEASRVLRELEPGEADAWYYAAIAYTLKGEHGRAVEAYRTSIRMNAHDPYYPAGLAWSFARAGQRDSALVYLAEAEKMRVPLKEIGLVYGALGDLDRAFEVMERALETEPATMPSILIDPGSEPLKADPRWEGLRRRIQE